MDLAYPIGPCEYPEVVSPELRQRHIDEIAAAPARFRDAVRGLNDSQLDTPYRAGGWTVRQVVHHFADSHMNAYVRFRLALTEDEPTIKPYDQTKWAELKDATSEPVEVSLQLIDALHRRWVVLLNSLSDADFARRLRHPELGIVRLDTYLASYGWHCRHHAAHIHNLRQRMGWN
jgi:DinB family protein